MKIKYVLNVNESAPDGTMFYGELVEEPIRDYAVVSGIYSGWVDDVQEHMGNNYSFKEWNTERDGSGTAYHAGDKLYESTTLYTVWNGETLMPETMEILKGDKRYWLNVLTNFERTKISNALTSPSVREYDVVDYSSFQEWESGNSYEVGDRVKRTSTISPTTNVKGYVCIVANSSDEFDSSEWEYISKFPETGEINVVYIAMSENKAYYWDVIEEEYVCISGREYAVFTGATASANGESGLVPAPTISDKEKFLKGDGTWDNVDVLPIVTSSNNGRVLEVNNGEWAIGNEKIDKKYEISFGSNWNSKTWTGLTNFYGQHIWSDGENIYYSNGSYQYVLNKSTFTWSAKEWFGLTSFYGPQVWTDGENIYYSSSSNQYVLNKSTSTWSTKEWIGLTSFDGDNIWTDGENIYYSNYDLYNSYHYVLDKTIFTWNSKLWTGLTKFSGDYIWTDGENTYYSEGNKQYVLNKSTSTWATKTWSGFTDIYASYIWTDGKNVYLNDTTPNSYVLNKFTSTWSVKEWTELTSFNGTYIWSDGDNIYYSNGTTQYALDKDNSSKLLLGTNGEFNPVSVDEVIPDMIGASDSSAGSHGLVPAPSAGDEGKFLKGDGTWDNVEALPVVTSSDNGKVLEVNNGEWTIGSEKIDKKYDIPFSSNWSIKTWNGLTDFYGSSIWTDGDNIYYSKSSFSVSDQYVLDKSTSTWSSMTWNGFSDISGYYIWTDGDDIYLSNGSSIQYVLDKSTSTWSAKTWNGLTNFNGRQIWTDGNNIYCAGYYSYILDKSTSTWSLKEWNGLENVYNAGIWTDGDNIYYSYGANHYILDKSTSTWSAKTWNGLTNFYGEHVWTNNNNIYYSYNSNQYILDKSTSTWSVKEWTGLTEFNESYIWTDGENIYCSNGSTQYALDKDNSPKLLLGTNGEFSPVGASEILPSDMTGASSSAAGTHGLVPAPSAGDEEKFLKGDGTWGEINTSSSTVHKVSFTIATTDWTQSSNSYVADVTDSHITSTTEELIMYTNSVKNLTSDIDTNKDGTNNKITFIVGSVPTGAISGSIYIISQGNIVADTKVDIDQGVENAGKFLVVNSQGNVEPVTMQAWQGGSY